MHPRCNTTTHLPDNFYSGALRGKTKVEAVYWCPGHLNYTLRHILKGQSYRTITVCFIKAWRSSHYSLLEANIPFLIDASWSGMIPNNTIKHSNASSVWGQMWGYSDLTNDTNSSTELPWVIHVQHSWAQPPAWTHWGRKGQSQKSFYSIWWGKYKLQKFIEVRKLGRWTSLDWSQVTTYLPEQS